jgi:uncharacterized membrane protein YecN with MAPEG domain
LPRPSAPLPGRPPEQGRPGIDDKVADSRAILYAPAGGSPARTRSRPRLPSGPVTSGMRGYLPGGTLVSKHHQTPGASQQATMPPGSVCAPASSSWSSARARRLPGLGALGSKSILDVSPLQDKSASQQPAAMDDPLFVAIRAHGNAAEYVPTMAVLMLVMGSHHPATWMLVAIIVATAARFVHAVGVLRARRHERAGQGCST